MPLAEGKRISLMSSQHWKYTHPKMHLPSSVRRANGQRSGVESDPTSLCLPLVLASSSFAKHKLFVRKPTGQECPVYRLAMSSSIPSIVVSFSILRSYTPPPIDGTFLSRQGSMKYARILYPGFLDESLCLASFVLTFPEITVIIRRFWIS